MKIPNSVLLTILLFPVFAKAECSFFPGHGLTDIRIDIPATLSIPRDTPNGTVLYQSAPFTANNINSSYHCAGVGASGIRNNVGGSGADQYLFPIGNTGLAWQWMLYDVPSKAYPLEKTSTGGWGFNGSVHTLKIVKIADVTKTQKVPAGILGYMQFGEITPLSMSTAGMAILPQSCETPDIRVDMGTTNLSLYSEYGKHSEPVRFNIKVNNCPQGINKITYTLAPTSTSPSVSSSPGTVRLDQSSTAAGISLQLLDSNQTPVEFNTSYTFADYSVTGGNFTIPLLAQFIRTAPTGKNREFDPGMSAGTANANIWFIMNYL